MSESDHERHFWIKNICESKSLEGAPKVSAGLISLNYIITFPKKRGGQMKLKEKKPETVYRIIDRKTKESVGAFSRAYCDEYDFESVEQARNSNVHGKFIDKEKYAIAQYKVTYELINPDV